MMQAGKITFYLFFFALAFAVGLTATIMVSRAFLSSDTIPAALPLDQPAQTPHRLPHPHPTVEC
ncbi:MAG: hypothetical protein VX699_00445 [Myxococcota bacterium]|nr:hypothetical protein [Myxococcota bacterium]